VRHGDLRPAADDRVALRRQVDRAPHVVARGPGATHWLSIEVSGKKKLVAVVIDPERTYFIDTDMSNNSWFDATDRVAPWRWTERIFERYVHVLHWQAGSADERLLQANEIDTTPIRRCRAGCSCTRCAVTVGRTPVWVTATALLALLALAGALPWFTWFDSSLAHATNRARWCAGRRDVSLRPPGEPGRDGRGREFARRRARPARDAGRRVHGRRLAASVPRHRGPLRAALLLRRLALLLPLLRVLLLTLLMLHLLGWLVTGAPWKWLVLDNCFG